MHPPSLADPQHADPRSTTAPIEAAVAPPAGPAGILALQRGAGNAAVARLLAGRPQAVARAPSSDAPELPAAGDANLSLLDSERQFLIDPPDLEDFDIGVGKLSTGPIVLGEGVEGELEVGAHNPPRIADLSLHISPVQANVAAELVDEYRTGQKIGGIEGAAIGGVLGGLAGMTPVGLLAGLDPFSGAGKGGVAGGKLGASAIDHVALTATLTSGAVAGRVRLVYSPYLRVRLGVELLSKLFDVNATLQTQIGLEILPTFVFVGSKVGLHFENGKLARSEFSLDLEAILEAALDVTGMLQIGATVLHILDNDGTDGEKQAAHDDPGLLNVNLLTTDVFPIIEDLRGSIAGKAHLDLLKASPLDLKGKHFQAKRGAIGDLLAHGMDDRLGPAVKKARAGKGSGTDPGVTGGGRFHKGTFQDPIPIIWFKPPEIYPDKLVHHGGDDVYKFPHRRYADGLEAGVDSEFWAWPGKKFKKQAGTRAGGGTTTGQADLKREFDEHDVEYHGDVAQIDHVFDDFLGGPDLPENLWPLKTKDNQDAGLKHGHQGVRYQPPDGPPVGLPTAVHDVPAGAWFIITELLQPGDGLPPEGAPEYRR